MAKPPVVHVNPKLIAAAVEKNASMRELQSAVKGRFKTNDATARAFAERLLTRAVERFGTKYLNEMAERITRIFENREKAAAIVEEVIGSEALTPEEAGRRLENLFKDMKQDVEAITGPEAYAKKSKIDAPDKTELQLTPRDNDPVFKPKKPLSSGRHVEMLQVLRTKFKAMTRTDRKSIRKAADLAPAELWRAVSSETEAGQIKNIEALRARCKARGMGAKDLANLEAAIERLSLERARSQRLPGTAEAVARAEAVKKLPSKLRTLVEGDRQLEMLAHENPEALADFFASSGAKSRSALRAYIRRRMVAHIRGLLGEFTAAFQLGENLVLLKGPDYNVTIPGTDLVGVTRDGRVWLIDNKALSVEELGSVTSLIQNIGKNIEDDTATFKAEFGLKKDPHIGNAVSRLNKATKDIKALTNGLTPKEAASPKIQKQIAAILAENRIDRVITNAGGEVDGLSAGLLKAKIRLEDLNKPPTVDPKID